MKMLPRLQAEERLGLVEAYALGSGAYKEHDHLEMMRQLREQAAGEQAPPPARANPEQLAEMGFGVILVPAEKAQSDV